MSINDDGPKVSIYISTFNRLEKLKRAIDSVFAQDYLNWELLICDDASTDGTFEFSSELELRDDRVRYFRNESNKGACETRNLGIFNAKGKFITGLDDDDEFTPNRLSFFLKNWDDRYSFLCCNFKNKYLTGKEVYYYKIKKEHCIFNYKDMLFENEASNQIYTLTERLQQIHGFDKTVKRLQDWDTWLRLSFRYGHFVRYNVCTYIMNHDHQPSEIRVSQNEKIADSLLSLAKRNRELYSNDEYRYMEFIVNSMKGNMFFSESLYWTYKKKNPKFIVKYFLKR